MQENEMFSKIESTSVREKIFDKIVKESPELQIQMSVNQLMNVKSYKRIKNELIVFRTLKDQPPEQEVIINFILEPERYFMKSKLTQKEGSCHIELSSLLYKLQRRKNFRLSLPSTWKPEFTCYLQNLDKVDKVFSVHDLSSGGFSFDYMPNEFSISADAELEGRLKIYSRLDIEMKAMVRHYREVGTKAYPRIRVGLEFKSLSTKDESTIMAILMEIHREFFAKMK